MLRLQLDSCHAMVLAFLKACSMLALLNEDAARHNTNGERHPMWKLQQRTVRITTMSSFEPARLITNSCRCCSAA